MKGEDYSTYVFYGSNWSVPVVTAGSIIHPPQYKTTNEKEDIIDELN